MVTIRTISCSPTITRGLRQRQADIARLQAEISLIFSTIAVHQGLPETARLIGIDEGALTVEVTDDV